MISLLATLGGFLTSLIPEMFKIIKEEKNRKHDLIILEKQIELSKFNENFELAKLELSERRLEQEQLHTYQPMQNHIIDTLNGSVRPVLAYLFFTLYTVLKFIRLSMIKNMDIPFGIVTDLIWNLEDQAIFAGIIGFYFGQRAVKNIYSNRRN